MIELLPHVAPLIAAGLLQSKVVRGLLARIVPGIAWYCPLIPLICR